MSSYDITSPVSILKHAQELLGKSLRESCLEYRTLDDDRVSYQDHIDSSIEYKGKGGLGQSVEKLHFNYEPNSNAEPDFKEAGIELKCTPLKKESDGSMVSKERLVLNIIDYISDGNINTTFDGSSFWKKNKTLLLMFYLYEKGVDILDLVFKIIRLWNFPETDLKIIKDDWTIIHNKIVEGKAEEISEGDTLFLGACTKGTKGGANKRRQPYSEILADQRAYSLKSSYLNGIILDSLSHPEMFKDVAIGLSTRKKILSKLRDTSSIVRSIKEYKSGETFESLIERKFEPFYGKTINQIEGLSGLAISTSPKAVSYSTCQAILGVRTRRIAEFEKANLQLKTIRLEHNGRLVESMSFQNINYKEIINEDSWQDSEWYQTLTQRFLFVVFRKAENRDFREAVLEKVFFWTMPYEDLKMAESFWKDTRDKIRLDDFSHFIKISDNKICHVRPKARNSHDLMETASGRMEKKYCYWLNSRYILDIVNKHIFSCNKS